MDGLNLKLVQVILDCVAEVVGCDVDRFMVYGESGVSMHVDVLDPSFTGKVPSAPLAEHLCIRINEETGLTVLDIARCANEGGTVTIRVGAMEGGALFLEIGV